MHNMHYGLNKKTFFAIILCSSAAFPAPVVAGYWRPCTKDLKTNKYIIRDGYTGQTINKTVRGFQPFKSDSTRRYIYGSCYINDTWFLD